MIIQLTDLHLALLKDPRFPEYTAEFYKTLPYIVELRAKSGENRPEKLRLVSMLYGMLMLRLQSKEVTAETRQAITQISRFLALLSKIIILTGSDKLFPGSRVTIID